VFCLFLFHTRNRNSGYDYRLGIQALAEMAEKKVRYKSGKGSAVGSLVQIQTTLAPSTVVGYMFVCFACPLFTWSAVSCDFALSGGFAT
jgi:hypothetical protein